MADNHAKNSSSRKNRSDSGWVQRAVLAGRSVEGKTLYFKKTIHFKGKGLGRIYGCRITYTADPAIEFHKNARLDPRWMFGVENCYLKREGQRDTIGLLYDKKATKVGVK